MPCVTALTCQMCRHGNIHKRIVEFYSFFIQCIKHALSNCWRVNCEFRFKRQTIRFVNKASEKTITIG